MTRYLVLRDPSEALRAAASAEDIGANWVRLADQTVMWAASEQWKDFAEMGGRAGFGIESDALQEIKGQLNLVIQVGRSFQNAFPKVRTLVEKGGYLIVDLLPEEASRLAEHDEICWAVRPLPVNEVVLDILTPAARTAIPWVQSLVSAVSQTSYASYLTLLAGY